jgi:hypothetical protein
VETREYIGLNGRTDTESDAALLRRVALVRQYENRPAPRAILQVVVASRQNILRRVSWIPTLATCKYRAGIGHLDSIRKYHDSCILLLEAGRQIRIYAFHGFALVRQHENRPAPRAILQVVVASRQNILRRVSWIPTLATCEYRAGIGHLDSNRKYHDSCILLLEAGRHQVCS